MSLIYTPDIYTGLPGVDHTKVLQEYLSSLAGMSTEVFIMQNVGHEQLTIWEKDNIAVSNHQPHGPSKLLK